jgi:hypothetical protein
MSTGTGFISNDKQSGPWSRRHLDQHPVAGEQGDAVLHQLAGNNASNHGAICYMAKIKPKFDKRGAVGSREGRTWKT